MQFRIDNMACDGCVKTVTETIQGLDPQARIAMDPAARTVSVETVAPQPDIERALAAAGYPARATG
ncbi:heavy-metal-associated domain-containing protein [Pseudochelatococcus sp. B33]